ncbi:MAG: hypothetical protein CR993_00560 [Rhodobacterales bacterium]|nr:MAG: hypothetical protein CR993_00560 [Rhodobacterales bacterium]
MERAALLAEAEALGARHGAVGRAVVLSCRMAPASTRVVLRFGDRVLKWDKTGRSLAAFEADVAAHRAAFEALGAPRVPRLFSVDTESRSVLMQYAPGVSVQDLLLEAELGIVDARDVMRRAGRWIRAYHGATAAPARPIHPGTMLRWAEDMTQQVEARTRDVPRRDLFLETARLIPELGGLAAGQQTPAAACHGDLHLKNLLIGEAVTGIDFRPLKTLPTAHDLATFLANFAVWFDDKDGAAEAAFWQGYGSRALHDAALSYIRPITLLSIWFGLPKDKAARRESDARRLKGVLREARKLLGEHSFRRVGDDAALREVDGRHGVEGEGQ